MKIQTIYAAILGDLSGQPFEYKFGNDLPKMDEIDIFNSNAHITDDSILTLASCDYILQKGKVSLENIYKQYGLKFPNCGFGKGFKEWINTPENTRGTSWGNGSIMRISPFIIIGNKDEMTKSIISSHSHEISIQAGLNLYQLYHQKKKLVSENSLSPFTEFSSKADFSFQTINSIFHSTSSTHEAIKEAITLGGDTDTHASIVGGLSAFHYRDITQDDRDYVESKLPPELLIILQEFEKYLMR